MIDQKVLDEVADNLVATGMRVTSESLREAFRERNRLETGADEGSSHSPRDIQAPFHSWKHRRRYKPHLAQYNLSDSVELSVAKSLDAMRRAADRLPSEMPEMVPATDTSCTTTAVERLTTRLEKRLDDIVAENALLRRDLAALRSQPGTRVIRKGRKSGVFLSTSRHFWNQLMLVFQAHIKANGPKSLAELFHLIDDDSHALAAAAFEKIDTTVLKGKLQTRHNHTNYFEIVDGMYHLLPPEPRQPKSAAENSAKKRSKASKPPAGNR